MKVSVVSAAPTSQPVSIREVKKQLVIDDDDESFDTQVASLIAAATSWMEERLGRSLITQTRIQQMDNFYKKSSLYRSDSRSYTWPVITLLYPKVISITTFSYLATDGTTKTLTENIDFKKDIISSVPRLYPVTSWPAVNSMPGSIQITYVAGYGSASQVPGPIKQAILMLITHMFENRMEEIIESRIAKFEMNIDRMISTFEVFQNAGIND